MTKALQILDELNSDPFLGDLAREMIHQDLGSAASHLAQAPEELHALRSYSLEGGDVSWTDLEPLPTW